jgi:hypothetical protein
MELKCCILFVLTHKNEGVAITETNLFLLLLPVPIYFSLDNRIFLKDCFKNSYVFGVVKTANLDACYNERFFWHQVCYDFPPSICGHQVNKTYVACVHKIDV